MGVPAIASAHAHFLVLSKIAHGIIPCDVQCALKAQFPEFVLPYAVVVDKRYIMACDIPYAAIWLNTIKVWLLGRFADSCIQIDSSNVPGYLRVCPCWE